MAQLAELPVFVLALGLLLSYPSPSASSLLGLPLPPLGSTCLALQCGPPLAPLTLACTTTCIALGYPGGTCTNVLTGSTASMQCACNGVANPVNTLCGTGGICQTNCLSCGFNNSTCAISSNGNGQVCDCFNNP